MPTIIVNPTAASNGSGSLLDPKNTYAGLSVAPGDVVAQVAGTAFVATAEVAPSASGNSANPITYCVAEPQTGALITDGSQTAIIRAADGLTAAMNIGARIHIHLRGLTIIGTSSVVASSYGLNMRAGTEAGEAFNQVWYSRISCPGGTGIGARGRYLRVMHTTISACWADGIFGIVRDFELGYADVFDVDRRPEGTGDAVDLDLITDIGFTRIHNSRLRVDTPQNTKQCLLAKASAGTLLVEDNDLFGGGGATLYSNVPSTTVRRNLINNPAAPAFAFGGTGHVAELNDVELCDILAQFNETGAAATLRNNTIRRALRRLVSTGTSVTGCGIAYRNNAALQVGTGLSTDRLHAISAGNTWAASGNGYGGTLPQVNHLGTLYATLAAYQTASSQDGGALTGDLQVGPSGRPLPGSPLLPRYDGNGNPVPGFGGADLGYLRDRDGMLCRRFVGAYGYASRVRL